MKIAASVLTVVFTLAWISAQAAQAQGIGVEIAVPHHLVDGEEFFLPLEAVLAHGRDLFTANWTAQEGGGRPLSKGTGTPLADPSEPLLFPHNFNRVSGPDANGCASSTRRRRHCGATCRST